MATSPTALAGARAYGPIYGTDGDDLLTYVYATRNDTLYGGAGDDTIYTFRGDEAYGGTGDDYIEDKRTAYFDGPCLLFGGAGDDTLVGGTSFWDSNNDITGMTILDGGAGNDKLVARHEEQILNGGTGKDLLIGSWASATLRGGAGGDILLAVLQKHAAHPDEPFDFWVDKYGSSWTDGTMEGGAGNDSLFCAPENVDTIVLAPGGGRDVVHLFDTFYLVSEEWSLVGDLIDLTAFELDMTAAEVVEAYASVQNGDTLLRLSPDASLVLRDVAPADLVDQILV